MTTIQFDLGGGAAVALPADLAVKQLIEQLRTAATPATPRYIIGQHITEQGGIFAGDILGDDGVVYGLIIAESDLGAQEWGNYGTSAPGAASTWDGLSNTNALRGNGHPAARAASDHDAAGHADWYLPAKRELQIAQANVPALFQKEVYWTSSQFSENLAWAVDFEYGTVFNWGKVSEFRVRPFRRFTY